MKKVSDFIKYWDNLGAEYSLSYKRAPRHESLFGAALTVIAYIVVGFASFTTIKKYFDRTNVDVSSSIQFSKTYPEINLAAIDLYPVIILFDSSGLLIPHNKTETFAEIEGYIIESTLTSLLDDSEGFNTTQSFDYIPCKKIKEKFYEKFYADPTVKDWIEVGGLCPNITDLSKFKISGSIVSLPFSYFQISVNPCSLADDEKCQEAHKVDGLEVNFVIPQYSFHPEDFENPVEIQPNIDEVFHVNIKTLTQYRFQFKNVEIEDDISENFFAKPKTVASFTDLDQKKFKRTFVRRQASDEYLAYCDSDYCDSYIDFLILSGIKQIKVTRKYTKLADVQGDVGGFLGLAISCFGFVYIFYGYKEHQNMKVEIFCKRKKTKKPRKTRNPAGYLTVKKLEASQLSKDKSEEEIKDEAVEDRQDGLFILKSLVSIDVLASAFFSESHKKLLPVALNNYFVRKLRRDQSPSQQDPKKMRDLDQSDAFSKIFKKLDSGNHQNFKLSMTIMIDDLLRIPEISHSPKILISVTPDQRESAPNQRESRLLTRSPESGVRGQPRRRGSAESGMYLKVDENPFVRSRSPRPNKLPKSPKRWKKQKNKSHLFRKKKKRTTSMNPPTVPYSNDKDLDDKSRSKKNIKTHNRGKSLKY